MTTVLLSPLKNSVHTTIEIPGSLSCTIRALLLCTMVKGKVTIMNPSRNDDTYTMIAILKTLGITIFEKKNCFIVEGNITEIEKKEYVLNAHISGRTARMILPFLCTIPGIKTLTCDEAFKKRPVSDLVHVLRTLGARIVYLEKDGFLPIKILSENLIGEKVEITGQISSQYISSLLMIAPNIGGIKVNVIGKQRSKPFIDITLSILKEFGISVKNNAYKKYTVLAGQSYINPKKYVIEADAIAASYFWGIAALTKSSIRILHLSPLSPQGDIQFADILERMGCIVRKNEKESWIEVEGTDQLHGISVNMNDLPDSVLTLAVIASFAKGETKITGIEHLKIKESDRIENPKKELSKTGIVVQTTTNSITVIGGKPHTAFIDTYGDHRMAMAFSVAGSLIQGISIKHAEVVSKSFPTFFEKLKKIGVGVKKI
jgi:3-phosphoshikimate 1-carboxyvinyltransferase